MKKTKIFAMVLAAAGLTLASCSDDFLDVQSYTKDFTENYYTTEEHVGQALVAAYSPMEWNDWNGDQYNPQNLMSDLMGDDVYPGGASATDNEYYHLMAKYAAIPTNCMKGIWSNMYSGVKRCNDALAYADQSKSNISQTNYDSWTSQARVLRAYYYCLLWKFWGNIPFYFTNLSAPFEAPQYTPDEVYKAIVEDLEKVIELDALPTRWNDDNLGRVNKYTAYMLYADWVMYQNDESRMAKALGYMNEIIADSSYSLHGDYASLWQSSNEWCEESIFEVMYSDNKTKRGWGAGDAIFAGGTVYPRLCGSPMAVSELGTDDGWGFSPVRRQTWDMFDAADARREGSILNLQTYNEAAGDEFKPRYQNTHLWIGKYYAYSRNVENADGDKQLNYNNNLRVYRYAETLLNAAELELRVNNNSAKAAQYVSQVRQRAGLAAVASVTLDDVLNERHLEFVGEGKRYWDLVRAEGIAGVTKNKASVALHGYKQGIDEDIDFLWRPNAWTPSKKYLPIPYTEIAANPKLKQNNY